MENNITHLQMVDIYSLRRQLRARLGDMRQYNWSEISFSVDFITGVNAIVEYKIDKQTRSLKVSVFGRMDSTGAEIPTASIDINGNDTNDADKLPDIALGLIVSNIYPQYLLVDCSQVKKTIYGDSYPVPDIKGQGVLAK